MFAWKYKCTHIAAAVVCVWGGVCIKIPRGTEIGLLGIVETVLYIDFPLLPDPDRWIRNEEAAVNWGMSLRKWGRVRKEKVYWKKKESSEFPRMIRLES